MMMIDAIVVVILLLLLDMNLGTATSGLTKKSTCPTLKIVHYPLKQCVIVFMDVVVVLVFIMVFVMV